MLLKSEHEAEDVAQDIFVKLWEQPDLWEDGLPQGYLFAMVKNRIFNKIKRRNFEGNYINSQIDLQLSHEAFGFEDPLNEMYREDIRLLLMLSLDQMPDKRREIFKMSRFQNLSNRDIADKMNLSVRTVEQHIYLALKELKKSLLLAVLLILA